MRLPVRSDRSGAVVVGGIVCLLLAAAAIGIVRNAIYGPPASAAVADVGYSSMSFGLDCTKAVTARLKAPSTAQFERPWPVVGGAATGYAMNSYVDSQNGFGATLRTRFLCTSKPGTKTADAIVLN